MQFKAKRGLSNIVSATMLIVLGVAAVAILSAIVIEFTRGKLADIEEELELFTPEYEEPENVTQSSDNSTEDDEVIAEINLTRCGNGIFEIDNNEQCDDGNRIDGDGCSSICTLSQCVNDLNGFVCNLTEYCPGNSLSAADSNRCCSVSCEVVDRCEECGTGLFNVCDRAECEALTEQCYFVDNTLINECKNCINNGTLISCEDYGNEQESCETDTCNIGNCSWDGAVCITFMPVCGNGALEPGEECDDGNTRSGDGCNLVCRIEICGNGRQDIGEECDDANTINGDGCSSECQWEEICGDGICAPSENSTTCAGDCQPPCFLPDTEILTLGQSIMIQDIKEGDIIMSYNELTGELEETRVIKTFSHTTNSYLVINNELKVTSNHLMFINWRWMEIGKANIGDKLIKYNGEEEIITSIEKVNERVKVYNLEVDKNNNYYADSYLAHNKIPGGGYCGDGECFLDEDDEREDCWNCLPDCPFCYP